ncbi:MAG: hypothetical protein QHH15_00395 [Candidatus Thermoplasmatota archaeon]|nr:hypothetical protein [Candidatus Thermoplasmatota archaeon]MDH7506233.1 hypothetical protein [Candidatus Thermoplasmatota archaeon]
MDKIKKLRFRIVGLQKKLTMVALLQRNYAKHYGRNKPKHDEDAALYVTILNKLRRELELEKAIEKARIEEAMEIKGETVLIG